MKNNAKWKSGVVGRAYSTLFSSAKHTLADVLNRLPRHLGIAESFSSIPASLATPAHSPQAFIVDSSISQHANYADSWAEFDRIRAKKAPYIMMLGLRGFPNVQGGVESHVEHLTPLLVQLGCKLEVVVRSPYQPKTHQDAWQGVTFTRLWAPKTKMLEAIVHTFLGVLYAAIKRPDILHIQAIGPALMTPLARLLGLKVVVTHHGPDYDRQKWGGVAKTMLKMGEYAGMRLSSGRIVISNVIKTLVKEKHAMHAELIFNGVNVPNLDVTDAHLQLFGLKKHRYILLVSRLVPEKRHLDLINAFNRANIQDCKLVLVGCSDHPDAYVQTIQQAAIDNPNIVLTGFQKGDILKSLYTHAGLFVLPSSHEGLSISLLEALSFGLPVVASNIQANLEVALDDDSYFELGDVAELAQKLQKNMQSPMTDIDKTRVRQWIATQYNWGLVAEKTYKEYERVIQAH